MCEPKEGDLVRVINRKWYGAIDVETFTLEKFHYCLGFFQSDAHRASSRFTPLCECLDNHPEGELKYWPNFGEYWSETIPSYEIISSKD